MFLHNQMQTDTHIHTLRDNAHGKSTMRYGVPYLRLVDLWFFTLPTMIYYRRQTTTSETPCSALWVYLCLTGLWTLTGLWDWAYSLLSLSKKTRVLNHLQISLERQPFKDPECWSGQSFDPVTSHTVVRCSTNWRNIVMEFSREVLDFMIVPGKSFFDTKNK